MGKFEKIYDKYRTEMYKNAEIYKMCEGAIHNELEKYQKMLDRGENLSLGAKAKMQIYKERLVDIDRARDLGLYQEFKIKDKHYQPGYAEAKTDAAIKYLAKVEAEKAKDESFDLFGMRERKKQKQLKNLAETADKYNSKKSYSVIKAKYERLEKLYKSTEGNLTRADKIQYDSAKKYYEKLEYSMPTYSRAEWLYKQQHSYLSDSEMRREMAKDSEKFARKNNELNRKAREDAEFKKRVARRNARYEDQTLDF